MAEVFSLSGSVHVDTSRAKTQLDSLDRSARRTNKTLEDLGRSSTRANSNANKSAQQGAGRTAAVQVAAANRAAQAAQQAARLTAQANQQAARLSAQAAQQASRAQQQAARDAARVSAQVQRDATRSQTQSQRDVTRAAQQSARDVARAQQQAQRDATKAAERAARDATRAGERAAREAQRQAEATARVQQRAADQAARAAQRAADATRRAQQRATDENIRNIEREMRARERARQAEERQRRQRIDEGRRAAGQLADKGSTVATAGGLAVAGGFILATREAINFEEAFTGVTKTVDATDKQLADLSKGIREMATTIPVTTTELSTIAQSAGQLGIAVPSILGFTRTIADLGASTNLASEQGATELARFANVTKMSQSEFSNLGSSLVALGNNFATTESEISSMALRLADQAHMAGIARPKILGFATALSALGIEAEAGGTAMGKVFSQVDQAARFGSKSLDTFAKTAGMSKKAFQELYKRDASAGVLAFITGLGKLQKAGGNTNAVLAELGMSDVRVGRAMRNLAGNPQLLARALAMSDKAWRENTALANEAAKRYGTTASKIKIAQNELKDFGITIGTTVLPALNSLLKLVKPTLDRFNNLSSAEQESTIKMVAFAGASLLVLGRLKGLVDTFSLLRTAYIGLQAANAGAIAGGTAWGGVLTGLGAIALPALAVAATAATAAVGLYKINQERAAESAAKLRGANAGLEASARDTEKAFDSLAGAAVVNPGAAKAIADLRAEFGKLKDTDLAGFLDKSLPKARNSIKMRVDLDPLAKRVLLDEVDALEGKVKDQLQAKEIKIAVKAEVDQGALANVRESFYRTYKWLYDQWKGQYIDPVVGISTWGFNQVKYAADVSFAGISQSFADFGVDWSKGWGDLWDGIAGTGDTAAGRMADTITRKWDSMLGYLGDQWSAFLSWFNGTSDDGSRPETAGHGDAWLADQQRKHKAYLAQQAAQKTGLSSSDADPLGDPGNPKAKRTALTGLDTPEKRRAALDARIAANASRKAKADADASAKAAAASAKAANDLNASLDASSGSGKKKKVGKSAEEKAADREQKEALRREKDALGDVATAHDQKAKAAQASAKVVVTSAKTELEALENLRDTFADTFTGLQDQFVSLGIIDNPLAPAIKWFEDLLDVAGKSGSIVDDARKRFNSFQDDAISNSRSAANARSRQEVVSGLDGVVPSGGNLTRSSGSAPAFMERMFAKVARSTGVQCGQAISDALGSPGFATRVAKGLAGTTVRPVNGRLPDGAVVSQDYGKAAQHFFVAYTDANGVQRKLESTTAGGKGRHYRSDRPITSNDLRRITRAALPRGVSGNLSAGGGSYGNAGFSSGGGFRSGSSSGGAGVEREAFDLEALDGSLSKIGAVDKAWGTAVKNIDGNSSRFAMQTALASKEFQAQIQAAATRSGKSVPEIIKWLRALGNAADTKLNRAKAVEAVTAALVDLEKARKAIGSEKNPLASLLNEFEAGGKFAAAADKKASVLDAQMSLSLAQTATATKEATDAERARTTALREAAPLLTQAGLANGDYDRALEKVNRRFEVWKSPDVSGLLDAARSYDELANSALKAANAIALKKGALTPAERAEYNRLKAQAGGYKGRAAGVRASANQTATGRLDVMDKAANDAVDQEAIKKYFQQSEAAAQSLGQRGADAFKTLKTALGNSALSAQDLQNVLRDIDPLLADMPGIAEKLSALTSEAARRGKAELASLTDDARLAREQSKLAMQYAPDSPDLARENAMLEERNRLTLEYKKLNLEERNGFNFDGKLAAFGENFDAQTELANTRAYRAATAEAAQATALFGDVSSTSGIKYRTAFGDLKGMPEGWKTEMIDATASIARMASATDAMTSAQAQQLDLQKQIESGRAEFTGRKPLTGLQQQELDWKFSDRAEESHNGPRLAAETRKVNAQRDAVRGLMTEWQKFEKRRAKIEGLAQGISGAFMSGFDAVLSRQKSFADAFLDSLRDMLMQAAMQVIQSKLTSELMGLFSAGMGGAPAGGAPASLALSGGGAASPSLGSGFSLGGSGGGLGNGFSLGVHASGLERVPHDNYPMLAHKNEQVLTAAQAESWRQQQQAKEMAIAGSSRSRGDSGSEDSSRSGGGSNDVHLHLNGPTTVNAGNSRQMADEIMGQRLPRRETKKRLRNGIG